MKVFFESERLIFRLWKDSDKSAFAKMNSDLKVMEFFPKTLTENESNSLYQSINEKIIENDYGLWAVETKQEKEFIGFIGFNTPSFESDFTPCIEIGWRLKKEAWGRGYATEGARICLAYGFIILNFREVFSFTSSLNKPSEKIMKKTGMQKVREFMHPNLEDPSPLKKHLLYKITKNEYESSKCHKLNRFL